MQTTETTDYVTQDMLALCEIQDKGKGPYTEISTLLSEYLVIQVQESINLMNCVACLDSLTRKCSLIFFDNLLYTCGISSLTESADLLSKNT